MKWGILNLSPVARKVWWEKVKRVSFPTTPCSGRARYEEFRFSLCVTCEQALPGVQGWGEEREEWERMLWRACSQATLCAIVLFEHAVIVTLDQSILLFFARYPRSILTSFTSNCLLSTRLRHLTAFDGVVTPISEQLSPWIAFTCRRWRLSLEHFAAFVIKIQQNKCKLYFAKY